MIVDLMGQKFEPEPEIITIKGGLQPDASGAFAQFGDTLIERTDNKSIDAFQIRARDAARAAGAGFVTFGGLPRMNANGGGVNLKENEGDLRRKT